jgi:hypothetical protein
MIDKFKSAYKWHKTNATQRGIDFLFTFEEWRDWWIDSGKWEFRGVGSNKYCMCRFNDVGPYAVWNVYCATNSKNLSDANKGKPKSKETRAKISAANTGKAHPWAVGDKNPMHKQEVKEKVSKAISGENHYNHKGVNSPSGYFVTTKIASQKLGIPKPTIEWRCKNNKLGFSYAIA